MLHRRSVVALRCDGESAGLNERQTDTAVVVWMTLPVAFDHALNTGQVCI
jgi:hypothetical protein